LSGRNLQPKGQPVEAEKKIQRWQEPKPEPESVVTKVEDTPSASVAEQAETQMEAPKPVGRPFVFKLLNKETGSGVNGLVRLQE
jgi:hypothetical protein